MLNVIIVNYNGGTLLCDCLQSLYDDLGDSEAQVWLVDNASTDDSLRLARERFPQARLIVNQRNVGYAAANNQALRAILDTPDKETRRQGDKEIDSSLVRHLVTLSPHHPITLSPDYVLLLNPDVVVQPGAIAEMLRCMKRRPDVGIAGPRIVRPSGELDWPCRRSFKTPAIYFYKIAGLDRLFPRSYTFGRYYMRYLPEDQPAEIDAIIGAFMLVRRAMLDEIGLLDERFYIYCEDEDLCWRAKQAGWQVYYHPAAVVTHVKGASTSQRKLRMIYEWHKAIWQFHRKNMAGRYGLLVNALVYAGMAATLGMKLAYHSVRNISLRIGTQRLSPHLER